MAQEETRNGDLEEVLIASRSTDEDLEAGLLNSSSVAVDSQGKPIEMPKQKSSVKRNVSELGQRVRNSFNGQSEAAAPVPIPAFAKPPGPSHPTLPKSAMKKAGEFAKHSTPLPDKLFLKCTVIVPLMGLYGCVHPFCNAFVFGVQAFNW